MTQPVKSNSKQLIASSDRKVKFWSNQYNTFGLLPGLPKAGGTCPGATCSEGGCWYIPEGRKLPVCYACKIIHCYGGVRRILEHNTKLLTQANQREMERLITDELNRFRTKELAHAERNGTRPHLNYRLHWSGDLFSERYTRAWANVIRKNKDIMFWGYTRSFNWIKYFTRLPNLLIYLSIDPINKEQGLAAYRKWKRQISGLRVAYMGTTNNLKELKLVPCPVDAGRLDLEEGCARCARCWKAGSNVYFATT